MTMQEDARLSSESRVGREFYLLVYLSPKLGTTCSLSCSSNQFNQDFVDPVTCIFSLVDENECRTGMANCGQHASCTNTPGFYNCSCRDGRTKHARKRPCSKRIEDNCKNLKCDKTASCGYRGRCTCKSGLYEYSSTLLPHGPYDRLDVYNFYKSRSSHPDPLYCIRRTRCSVITLF